ncbi:hypothetical protein BHE74_00020453, partial [Ensete ventricosum]
RWLLHLLTDAVPLAASAALFSLSRAPVRATTHRLSVLCKEGATSSFSLSNDDKSPANCRLHAVATSSSSPFQRSLPPAVVISSNFRCRSRFQPAFFTTALFLCLLPMKHLPSSSQPSPPLPSPTRLPWAPRRIDFLFSLTPATNLPRSPAPPPTSAGAAPPPLLPPLSPSSRSLHPPLASSAATTPVVYGSILGTASPAAPPVTPPPPMVALSSPAHLTPSSMAPTPLPVSSCWKHSSSPIGPSPTLGSVAPSFLKANRLASLDSTVADGAQVLLLTPLPRAPLPWSSIYYDQQRRRRKAPLLPLSPFNPRSRRLHLGMIILLQLPLPIAPTVAVILRASWFNRSSWIQAKEITTFTVGGCRALTTPLIFSLSHSMNVPNNCLSDQSQEK